MTVDEKDGVNAGEEQFAEADRTSSADGAATAPSGKRPMAKKTKMTIGVIAAVIVVAVAGFWVWHETPGFCNSICHSPMDSYVESYYSEDPGMLVTAHAEAGDTCLSCHEAELTTQISEVMAWVSDSYPMDGDKLASGKEFANEEFCARPECHDMGEVVANTWGFEGNDAKYNPHSSHQDLALECSDCHKAHDKSVLVCNDCHDLNAPEGWE